MGASAMYDCSYKITVYQGHRVETWASSVCNLYHSLWSGGTCAF